jgi:hypothetical protein
MNLNQITESNKIIREAMDSVVNIAVPDLVLEKLNKLSSVLGTSSQCVADSEKIYNDKIGELILAKEYKSLGATDKKLLFQSLASEEIHLLNYSSQLNKDLHYAIESCRSMLSFIKSEMEQSMKG